MVESVFAGLRNAIDDDDQLVKAAATVFEALLASFEAQAPTKRSDLHLRNLTTPAAYCSAIGPLPNLLSWMSAVRPRSASLSGASP